MANVDAPNIILINCDDLGYGDLGCYGSTLNDTPAIDRLAREGMRFTDFYAPAPVCTPSRAGLMCGCYPKRMDFMTFGVYDHRDPGKKKRDFVVLMPGQPEGLHPSERTIANVLKDAGYATKIIGKWHMGDQPEYSPLRFGFESWFGLPYSNDMGLHHPKPGPLTEMAYTLCPLPLMKDDEVIQEQPDQTSLTEAYTRDAIGYIRGHREGPFFLYIAHLYVHYPLFVPQEFHKVSRNGIYGASIAAIDWSVAVILDELQRLGIDEKTLVIFTSDNGGDLRGVNAPLRGNKGSTWEGGQRVPCIMRWPKRIAARQVCSEIATMMDFYPTFADLSGGMANDGKVRDGYSLLPILDREQHPNLYQAFCYFASNELQAIRVGRYKLHFARQELYDLQEDVGEVDNLAVKYPDIVAEINTLADRYRADLGDSLTKIVGRGCRSKGFVSGYAPLTAFDPQHPYIVSAYDVETSL